MAVTSLNISDGTVVHSRCSPRRKRIFAIITTVLLLIIICFGLFYYYKMGESGKTGSKKSLVPPNPEKPLPPSGSTLHRFKKAAVCVDSTPCAKIGKDILGRNGSAMDATLAALFCNGVVAMQSMGLGGGFLMTIYSAKDQKAFVLNARETAPFASNESLYRNDKFKSKLGPLAIAVPGELRGYWEAHRRFGRLPWRELVLPAISLCEEGYEMTKHQHDALNESRIENDTNLSEWFKKPGGLSGLKAIGSKIIPKKLCDTLKIVADEGGDTLYNGTLSKLFLEDLKSMGSLITERDLRNYTVQWMEPVSVKFRSGHQLYSVPPPGSGALLTFILAILDGFQLKPQDLKDLNSTVHTYHKMIESFKYAFAKRTELGDTNFVNITELLNNLTSMAYADEYRAKMQLESTSNDPSDYGAVFYNKEDHGTAHISVLTENGDAVSVTSSINLYFGSSVTSNQTGILLNSQMDDFSFPFFTNYFGIPGSPANRLVPGKRPLSSMSPSILTDSSGNVQFVVGASGGTKITTALAQVIARILWLGNSIKQAVDAPRIHHQLFPMKVEYEYGTIQSIVTGLERFGHITERYRDVGSIVCVLLKNLDAILGNADYRKNGDVNGID